MNYDQFDKFTERARKVLTLSQEEASRLNHNYIGTEHLLLGLVREDDGVAAKVLINLGVELNRVRSAVEFIIGRGDSMILGEIGMTPRAKKVIDLSVDEARQVGNHYIGTEHLLLGLIREGEGIAAGVLESLAINLEQARAETLRVLGQPQETAPSVTSTANATDVSRGRMPGLQPLPSSMRWEYLDLQVGYPSQDGGGYVKYINGRKDTDFGSNKTYIYNALQQLGGLGWELVSVDNPNGNSTHDPHYLLKRAVPDSIEPWITYLSQQIAKQFPSTHSPTRQRSGRKLGRTDHWKRRL